MCATMGGMSVAALFQAYFDARRNKRRTPSALQFEVDYERKLFALYEEIMEGRYRIGPSVCFICFHPVQREIFAAGFRDRIVHQFIYNYISPLFERLFIHDSYSCRTGKGTSEGIRRVDHFIRSCSENYSRDCYVLKLDIRGYFMAMDRAILYGKVARVVRRYGGNIPFDMDVLLRLIRQVVFHDPTRNCRVRGRRADWKGLPRSKSLFWAEEGKGLPIGNLTSQLFGNVYLDGFDHFMKGALGCRYYGRYVDDCVVVHRSREHLRAIVPAAKTYLRERLALELHDGKTYLQHASKGVPFLGAVIKPHRTYIGRKTKASCYRAIGQWREQLRVTPDVWNVQDTERLVACINSYLGAMRHYRSYRLRSTIVRNHLLPSFGQYVRADTDATVVTGSVKAGICMRC